MRVGELLKPVEDLWKKAEILILAIMALAFLLGGCSGRPTDAQKTVRVIITSDSILSGMVASLLPSDRYAVEAILPPGQCPGHYDVKLSDIEKIKKADLVISLKGMPFMKPASPGDKAWLSLDTGGHNWMVPGAYLHGVNLLADLLSERYPEEKDGIISRKKDLVRQVTSTADALREKIRRSGLAGKCVIASSLQKEPLEWMGFRVVGEYGRPEAVSAREVVRLSKIGRESHAMLVVDNLQSGPDTGKGIAEALGVHHVVLTNFPLEKGYLVSLRENVDTVLDGAGMTGNRPR